MHPEDSSLNPTTVWAPRSGFTSPDCRPIKRGGGFRGEVTNDLLHTPPLPQRLGPWRVKKKGELVANI